MDMKLADLRQKYKLNQRPKKLRFFWELTPEAQRRAVDQETENAESFDWDDAAMLTEDFKMQLAENGFPDVEVFWSLGYCQGDGVAFYGSVYPENLKEKDPQARKFIEALEKAGEVISFGISGENNHHHHWNSMSIEVEFESDDDEHLPPRLQIARPVMREQLEEYLSEKVKEISRELERSGYGQIEYKTSESAVREHLAGRDHLYAKSGNMALREYEFYKWAQSRTTDK